MGAYGTASDWTMVRAMSRHGRSAKRRSKLAGGPRGLGGRGGMGLGPAVGYRCAVERGILRDSDLPEAV